ncbi:MAG: amino acid ABC transporter permease [Methylocystis sp.]
MAVETEGRSTASRFAFLNDVRIRGIILQVVVLVLLIGFAAFIIHNTASNLARLGVASGFGFLDSVAGFDISITLIDYRLTSTNFRVFLIGLLNTLLVSACGIVLATLVGFVVGVLRLSNNWLIARLATVYVETLRNVPLLLQIVFWYFGVLATLPGVRQSLSVGDIVYLNNRGLVFPSVVPEPGFMAIPLALLAGIVAAIGIYQWARRRQERTGQQFPAIRVGLALIFGLPLAAAALTGFPLTWDLPELKGFNFTGGTRVLPEFAALLLALSLYTGAFIAEIVRSGIQSVSHGQTEAALALGLRPATTTRLIVIPQALRVIVPPLTSQYLNLTKNSSLAVVIGYPDLVSVFSGTVLNQTGQAVEVIAITMAVYLTISLIISLFMNWYNRRVRLVER